MEKITLYAREHLSEFSICVGLIAYLVGILFLTALDSPIFVVCSYLGTFLFVGGIVSRLGLFPATWKSRSGLSVVFFFVSAQVFTTAVVALFIGVNLSYNFLAGRQVGGPSQPPVDANVYGYNVMPTMEQSALGNINLQIERVLTPWILPLIEVGITFLAIAVALAWLSKAL